VKERSTAVRKPVATSGMERAGNRTIQAKSKVPGRKLGGGGDDQSPQGSTEVCLWYGCHPACKYTASAYWKPMMS